MKRWTQYTCNESERNTSIPECEKNDNVGEIILARRPTKEFDVTLYITIQDAQRNLE